MTDVSAAQAPLGQARVERVAALYGAYATRTLAYVRARLGRYDWHLAEDLTSETFLRVTLKIHQLKATDDKAFPWIAAIARSVIANYFQLARNRRERPTDFEAGAYRLPTAPAAEDVALANATIRAMLAEPAPRLGVAA